jgi:hypothetical protein
VKPMNAVIPDNIRTRIEVFAAEGKTGQITLNVYCGGIVSADIREHIKSTPKIVVDNAKPSD